MRGILAPGATPQPRPRSTGCAAFAPLQALAIACLVGALVIVPSLVLVAKPRFLEPEFGQFKISKIRRYKPIKERLLQPVGNRQLKPTENRLLKPTETLRLKPTDIDNKELMKREEESNDKDIKKTG